MNSNDNNKNFIELMKRFFNYKNLLWMDRKILFALGFFLIVLLIFYYYYLLVAYPSQKGILMNNNRPKVLSSSSTISYDSPMPPSNVLGDNSKSSVLADKIPANYINAASIPEYRKALSVGAFDILYDFFIEVNNGNFDNGLKFLDTQYKNDNKITSNNLKDYFNNVYFAKNSFFIESIYIENNVITATLFIRNPDVDGIGFYINYKITNTAKKAIIIDDLVNYLNTGK